MSSKDKPIRWKKEAKGGNIFYLEYIQSENNYF